MGARRVSGSLSFFFLLLITGHATAETAVAPSPVATAVSSSTAITTTSTGPPTTTTSRAVARRCGKRHRRRCRRGRGRCPIAKAGPDQFTQTMTTVRFDGGDSFDPHDRSEEHTSELQSQSNLACRLLLVKKKSRSMHILSVLSWV